MDTAEKNFIAAYDTIAEAMNKLRTNMGEGMIANATFALLMELLVRNYGREIAKLKLLEQIDHWLKSLDATVKDT